MRVFSDESTNISNTYFTGQENPQLYDVCVLDRPEKLSDETVEKLINTFIATGCHIDLQCIVYFLVYASVVMVISLCSFIIKRKSYFVFFI